MKAAPIPESTEVGIAATRSSVAAKVGMLRAASLALLILLFIAYIATAPSSVTMEDSGEFLVTARFLGLSHPPGYPLYTLLSWLVGLVPFGAFASRVHALNGFFGVMTAGLVWFMVGRSTGRWAGALGASLLLGVSPIYWYQSTIAEVYMLQALLTALLLCALVLPPIERTPWLAIGITLGLLAANHWPLLGLITPGLGPELYRRWRREPGRLLFLGLIIGLLPYGYLFIAARFSSYLFLGPIDSISEFMAYVNRDLYQGIESSSWCTVGDSLDFLKHAIRLAATELSWLGIPLAVIGLVCIARRHWSQAWLLGWSTVSVPLVLPFLRVQQFTEHSRDFYEALLPSSLVPAAVLIGVGMVRIMDSCAGSMRRTLSIGFTIALGIWLILQVRKEWQVNDTFAQRAATLTLTNLPENAILFTNADEDMGPLGYLHLVESARSDVQLFSQRGLTFPNRLFDPRTDNLQTRQQKVLAFLEKQWGESRRVFTTDRLSYLLPLSHVIEYNHYGLFLEALPPQAVPTIETQRQNRLADDATRLLTDIMDGTITRRWGAHQDTVISRLCHTLLLAGRSTEQFDSLVPCHLIRAQHLFLEKQAFAEADVAFTSLMPRLVSQPLGPQTTVALQFVLNRTRLAESEHRSPYETRRLLAEAARQVFPLAWRYRACDNQLVPALITLGRETRLGVDIPALAQRFSFCQSPAPGTMNGALRP